MKNKRFVLKQLRLIQQRIELPVGVPAPQQYVHERLQLPLERSREQPLLRPDSSHTSQRQEALHQPVRVGPHVRHRVRHLQQQQQR